MVETTAKIENDCKIIELMFKNSKYYDVSIEGYAGIRIKLKSANVDFFILFEEIRIVVFMSSGNVQIRMKSGAYIYINQTIEMIKAGL
jgi:hypothetical protein